MKRHCLALLCSAALLAPALRAQDDEQQKSKPQEEIPDFSEVDQFIYVPHSAVNFGFRFITGPKVQFSGNGVIPALAGENGSTQDGTTPNIARVYHDGTVVTDSRTINVDNGDGTTSSVPLNGVDGKTNTWGYTNDSQLTADGYMNFHIYSGASIDPLSHGANGRGDLGFELSMVHDMGTISKKLSWKLFGGVSLAGIEAGSSSVVKASITTQTDTYDLYGQTPPSAPYNAPSTTTQNLLDASGNVVTDTNGNDVTQTVDTTTLISNKPIAVSGPVTVTDYGSWVNSWKLHGAYLTFRFGPQLVYDITGRLKLVVSAGPAIVFAGSNYTVTEVFTPATGNPMGDVIANNKAELLPGAYADLNLQFDLTDRTGFYLGSFFQTAGHYTQTANGTNASYKTEVDLENQRGIRTGMAYKF
jgi:hypothetical protein